MITQKIIISMILYYNMWLNFQVYIVVKCINI